MRQCYSMIIENVIGGRNGKIRIDEVSDISKWRICNATPLAKREVSHTSLTNLNRVGLFRWTYLATTKKSNVVSTVFFWRKCWIEKITLSHYMCKEIPMYKSDAIGKDLFQTNPRQFYASCTHRDRLPSEKIVIQRYENKSLCFRSTTSKNTKFFGEINTRTKRTIISWAQEYRIIRDTRYWSAKMAARPEMTRATQSRGGNRTKLLPERRSKLVFHWT